MTPVCKICGTRERELVVAWVPWRTWAILCGGCVWDGASVAALDDVPRGIELPPSERSKLAQKLARLDVGGAPVALGDMPVDTLTDKATVAILRLLQTHASVAEVQRLTGLYYGETWKRILRGDWSTCRPWTRGRVYRNLDALFENWRNWT